MRKKVIVILLTALLFLSMTISGIATVYRVDGVSVKTSFVTQEAISEAETLRCRLEKAYEKTSIFSVNEGKAQEIIKEFPYFRITDFRKVYPNKLVLEICEDIELYAVEADGGQYYILGEDGVTLDIRDNPLNRLTKTENVLLKGLTVTAENGVLPTGDACFASVMEICNKISYLLGGIRGNVTRVEVFSRSPETIYVLTMREGVRVYIGNAKEMTLEKAERAVGEYLALSSEQKLSGRLVISDVNGELYATYAVKDEFLK